MTKCILVIDDDTDVCKLITMALARIGGYDVRSAPSGQEGIDLLAQWRPDAIILDVMMPGMDGPTTLERIRDDPSSGDIPVVFLTASVVDADLARLQALPVSGILAKPFDPMALPGEVAAILGW